MRQSFALATMALCLTRCAPGEVDLTDQDDSVVDGTITWERPEVGSIFVGGGMCTATLITPQVAVTAAHCIDFRTADRVGNYGRFVNQAGPSSPQLR